MVVPFIIACGQCFFCAKKLFAACEWSNPNGEMVAEVIGHRVAGAFGFFPYAGGIQRGPGGVPACSLRRRGAAEDRIRPARREGPLPFRHLSDGVDGGGKRGHRTRRYRGGLGRRAGCSDDDSVRLDDGRRTRSRAIDRVPERLALAASAGRAETINFEEEQVKERLDEMTDGRGPDRCIDAVGCEAHSHGSIDAVLDKAKKKLKLGTDRAHVLCEAIICCRTAARYRSPGSMWV